MKHINFKLTLLMLAVFVSIGLSLPSILQTETGKRINLGLDLQGGLHMVLEVESEMAVKNNIKSLLLTMKYYSEQEDILIDNIVMNNENVSFELLDVDGKKSFDKMLSEIKGINIDINKENIYTISYTDIEKQSIKENAVNKTVETIRNRLDMFGLSEPSVTKQGKRRIIVQIPGIKTQEEEKKARDLISKSAKLDISPVDHDNVDRMNALTPEELKKFGDIILPDVKDPKRKYLVKEIPILTGEHINRANVSFDQNNKPSITYELNSIGAKIFADHTHKSIGKQTAIILDGKVYSAPTIQERIGGGTVQITGDFTLDEASNISIALSSGSLSAPVKMLEKRSVGPSLGKDSITKSLIALSSGFVLVFIFMVVYYGYSGIVSNIALIANIFIIIAIMALFGATLTLPGMAGIVLTVGMAVDANVIINERIRGLLESGQTISKSISDGYNNAIRAILDANITTLLVAIILYAYGTGPIKGFAITISIGILASMLTAILGTQGVYQFILSASKGKIDKKKWFGVK